MLYPPVSYWMKVAAGILTIVALALLLVVVRDILVLVVASLVLALGLQPAVEWLVARRVKRALAVGLIFAGGFVLASLFLGLVIPLVSRQIATLVDIAPSALERAQRGSSLLGRLDRQFGLMDRLRALASQLPGVALVLARGVTSFLFDAVTVLILTAYFATAMPRTRLGAARLLHQRQRDELETIVDRATGKIGAYVMGNFVVSVIAGVVTFVALLGIGVPYAAVLSLWVALTDLIPTVGALLGAAAAVLVAAFVGWPQVIAAVIFFIAYQQIENYVIAPRVMKRAIDVSPAAVIVAVLVGATLAGFFGALLALPMAATIQIVLQELYVRDRIEQVRAADRELRRPWWRRRVAAPLGPSNAAPRQQTGDQTNEQAFAPAAQGYQRQVPAVEENEP